jgi:polyphosphate kinase
MGTGNYNPKTARLYTDMSFFTAKPEITSEVAGLFNTLTGFALTPVFKKLLVAPFTLHSKLQHYIRLEARNARKGKAARIIAQVNSLVDQETIDNLYAASQAGVKIDLIVRGICNLVPNVRGVSENIRVRSILGRYLEHSRLYYFENAEAGQPLVFAGSSDWMPRNFYRRIEAVFPIEDPEHRDRVIHVLKTLLNDSKNAQLLRANGAYELASKARKIANPVAAQDIFLEECDARIKQQAKDLKEDDGRTGPVQPPANPEATV